MRLRLATFLLLIVAAACPVEAKVFTLWPGRGGAPAQPSQAAALLDPNEFMSEPVSVNGASLRLKVGLINDSLARCLLRLRSAYPQARFDRNRDSARITVANGDRYIRLLLVQLGPSFPVIQFSMELPSRLPGRVNWPAELPITSDGVPTEFIHYPDRRVWYGTFTTSQRPQDAVAEVKARMASSGWEPASKNAQGQTDDRGITLIRSKPQAIMLVDFSADGHGAVVLRELKTE